MSPQRRNPGAWVEDTWRKADGTPSARDGRGKRWRVRVVDPAEKMSTRSFRVKESAKEYRDQVITSLRTATYVDHRAGRSTVGAAVQRYLDGLQVKPKTADDYRSVARSRVLPRWGEVPLDAVVPSEVSAWLTDMQDGEDAVSPARARKAGLILRSALKLAVSDRLIAANPAAEVKLPTVAKRRELVRLTAEELRGVSEEMPTAADRALLHTLALAGLRWGEATALQVKHLDHDARRITVARTYTDLNGSILEGVPKSHATRWVPMPAGLSDELQQLTKGKRLEDDVFRTVQGSVYRHRNWGRRVFRPALRRAGCDDSMKVHDLRGTFASLAVQAGANVKSLQRALGHESAALTLDTYAALYQDDLAGLGEQMNPGVYPECTEVNPK